MKPAASRIAILVGAGLVSWGAVDIVAAPDVKADPTAAMASTRARLASIAPVAAIDRDDWSSVRRGGALHTLSAGTRETAVLPAKIPAVWRQDRSVGQMVAQADQFGGFPPLGYDPEQDLPQVAPPPPSNPLPPGVGALPAAGGAAVPGGLSQFGAKPNWGAGATNWPGAGVAPLPGMAGAVPMPGGGADYSYGGPPAGMAGGADRWGSNVDYYSGQNFPSAGTGGANTGYQGFTASGMQGYTQPGGLPVVPNYPPAAGQQGANPYWNSQAVHPSLPGGVAMPGVQPGYPGAAGVQPYGGLPGQGGALPGLGGYPAGTQGLAPQGGLGGYPQQVPGLPGGYGAAPGFGYPYPPAYGAPGGYPYGAPGGYGLPGQGYGADPYRPRPPYPQPQSLAPSSNPWGGSGGQTVPASNDPAIQPPSHWGQSATVAEQQVQPGRYSPYQAQEAAPQAPAIPGWSGRSHGGEGAFPPIDGFHWERQMVPGQGQPSGRGPTSPVPNAVTADDRYPPLDSSLPSTAGGPQHWNTVSSGSDWVIR